MESIDHPVSPENLYNGETIPGKKFNRVRRSLPKLNLLRIINGTPGQHEITASRDILELRTEDPNLMVRLAHAAEQNELYAEIAFRAEYYAANADKYPEANS